MKSARIIVEDSAPVKDCPEAAPTVQLARLGVAGQETPDTPRYTQVVVQFQLSASRRPLRLCVEYPLETI
jgi:hypothetical protein